MTKEKQIAISGTAGELREFFKFIERDKFYSPCEIGEELKIAKERYKKLKGEQKKDENKN